MAKLIKRVGFAVLSAGVVSVGGSARAGGDAAEAAAAAQPPPANIRFEGAQVADPSGTVTYADLEAALATALPAVETCYGKLGEPGYVGAALVYLVFDKQGKVAELHIGGTGKDALEKCTAKALKAVKLARPGKGKVWATTDVSYGVVIGALTGDPGTGWPEGGYGLSGGGVGGDGGGGASGTIGIGSGAGTGWPGSGVGEPRPGATPKVTHGQATTGAGLDKDIVRRVMRRTQPRFQFCFEKQLAADPGLKEAEIVLAFVIGADGKVVEAAASSSTAPETMTTCVLAAVSAMEFPAPTGGGVVKVNYPLVFKLNE